MAAIIDIGTRSYGCARPNKSFQKKPDVLHSLLFRPHIRPESISSVPADHHPQAAQQNVNIQPDRPVPHVIFIIQHALTERGVISARDLPKTSQPGTHAGIYVISFAI